jgi:hypothetical protein
MVTELDQNLDWRKDEDSSWCVGKSNFEKIVTPSKLAPNILGRPKKKTYPAADRTWEHSLTDGNAIFEGNFNISIALKKERNGVAKRRFVTSPFRIVEAFEILADPSQLIKISGELVHQTSAENSGEIIQYVAGSRMTGRSPFQCESSGGWILNHPGPTNWSRRIATSVSNASDRH